MKLLEEVVTTGPSYGITIGTELALHTLFLEEAPNKLKLPLHTYDCLYINLYTLIRNVLSQFTLSQLENVTSNALVRLVLKDILLIERIVDNNIKLEYYASTLEGFSKAKYVNYIKPKYINRLAKTKKQRHVVTLQKHSIMTLIRHKKAKAIHGVLKIRSGQNIVLSNFMMNVISNITNTLLESHTGKAKDRLEWHTKFHADKQTNMKMFPALPKLLMFLGTKCLFSNAILSHLRDELINVAIQNKWSAITTEERVTHCLRSTNPKLYNNYQQTPSIMDIN